MKRKNLIWVISRLLIALMLAVLFTTNDAAQADDTTKVKEKTSWRWDKKAFQEYAKRIGEPDSNAAWLILDGVLMNPPYEVQVKDSTITINGISIRREFVRRTDIEVDSSTKVINRVVQDAWANFRMWHAEHGMKEARKRVFDFMKSQPIVEKIYWESDAHLRFLFHGEKYEDGMLLNPPYEPPLPPEEMRRVQLESSAKAIRGSLARGNLVILQDGVFMITSHPKSRMMIDRLIEIAETTADIEERTAAIREIIPDNVISRRIAERFRLK